MQPTRPSDEDIQNARENKFGAAREAFLTRRLDWRGTAPDWFDLDCRVCWSRITGGQRAVETGHAAFHEICYDALMEGRDRY